ncbi:MAG: hypothetical protein AABY22_07090, partial [Nanoarchaeota archaeon]
DKMWGKVEVRTARLIKGNKKESKNHKCWKFKTRRKEKIDTFFFVGLDEKAKNILKYWKIPAQKIYQKTTYNITL